MIPKLIQFALNGTAETTMDEVITEQSNSPSP